MRIAVFLFLFSMGSLYGQQAPDFTITDSDGIVHNLYEDHLDQGQTVVLKLFFTTCPPCLQTLPWVKDKYVQWGSGQYDVEFIEISTQAFDSNEDVADYRAQKGVLYPGVGSDGGSLEVAATYKSGDYGPYYGTPTFVIIAPDGTVTMEINYDNFDEKLAATGATGMEDDSNDDPKTVIITQSIASNSSVPTSVNYFLKPAGADTPKYNISTLTNGTLNFEYPSDDFPEIEDPEIIVEVDGPIYGDGMNVLDLLSMRKHILELDPFTE